MKLQSYFTIIYSACSEDTLGIPQLLEAKIHKVHCLSTQQNSSISKRFVAQYYVDVIPISTFIITVISSSTLYSINFVYLSRHYLLEIFFKCSLRKT